jgi:ATP-binding cassette subfamily C exporter for protease/lipase
VTNKLLLVRDGLTQAFGPSNQVLAALAQANQQAQLAQQQAAAQAEAARAGTQTAMVE